MISACAIKLRRSSYSYTPSGAGASPPLDLSFLHLECALVVRALLHHPLYCISLLSFVSEPCDGITELSPLHMRVRSRAFIDLCAVAGACRVRSGNRYQAYEFAGSDMQVKSSTVVYCLFSAVCFWVSYWFVLWFFETFCNSSRPKTFFFLGWLVHSCYTYMPRLTRLPEWKLTWQAKPPGLIV